MAKEKARDSQRSKLYRAERVLSRHPKNEDLTDIHRMRRYVRHILESKWFENYRPPVIDPENVKYDYGTKDGKYRMTPLIKEQYEIKDGRGRSRTAAGCRFYMTIPRHMRNRFTILHELAHGLQTEYPAHGRQFARIVLDLTRRWMGKEAHDVLRQSFRDNKVRYSKVKKSGRYVDNSIHLQRWRQRQRDAARGAENEA